MSRLVVENYVVFGVIVVTVTVTFQMISLPFIFSEIDSIRKEFDGEIHDSLKIFEESYENLAEIRPTSMRRERDLAVQMVGATSTGPADHPEQLRSPRSSIKSAKSLHTASFQRPSPRSTTRLPIYDDDDDDDYEEEPDILVELPKSLPRRESPHPPAPVRAPAPPPNRVVQPSQPQKQLPICPIEENRCPVGPPGPQGIRGVSGVNGEDGNDGGPGLDATDELTPTFAQFCTSCPAGPDGKPGLNGQPGVPGLVGAPGIPGPNGKNGQPGAPGGYGPPGKQGNMGIRGAVGANGFDGVAMASQRGPRGPVGKAGPPGQTGEDGTNNNVEGPRGILGYPGLQGAAGAPGLKGKRGDFGDQGPNGISEKEECKCDDMVKRAIQLAENSAYVAVEALAAHVPRASSTKSEIRRTPVKPSHISPLPTLEDVRRDQLNPEKSKTEELGEVKEVEKKIDVEQKPSLPKVETFIKSIKETSTTKPSGGSMILEKTNINTATKTLPIRLVETIDEESSTQTPESSTNIIRSAKFVDLKYPKWRKESGNAHVRKIRRKIRKINRRRLPTRFEMDKVFEIEKEITRDSDKKIKIGKDKKKLKRVALKPSKSLIEQSRKNTNILEEIAKTLGIVENNKKVENSSDKLTRVSIP